MQNTECRECAKQFTCKKFNEKFNENCTDKIKFSSAQIFEPERREDG